MKYYRQIVFKYLALLISICYLANPLQSQISVLFHEISHLLEAPNTIIEHSSTSDYGHSAHQYHEHALADDTHEHTLINIFDSIFNASDKGSPEESVLTDIKFDKHIATDQYPVKKMYPIEKKFNFIFGDNNISVGHLKLLEKPPRRVSL